MKKKVIFYFTLLLFLLSFITNSFAVQGFTQEDHERLIRLEATIKVFMEQINKRFEQIDKRFEQVDKRLSDLRGDVNKRFEQMDKRFEQIDKRFNELRMDMNKRFEQMITFLWILSAIFTTLTGAVIGFAYWDRRTIIRRAKDEAIEEIEKEGRVRDLIKALRKLAGEDRRLADVLRSFGLL